MLSPLPTPHGIPGLRKLWGPGDLELGRELVSAEVGKVPEETLFRLRGMIFPSHLTACARSVVAGLPRFGKFLRCSPSISQESLGDPLTQAVSRLEGAYLCQPCRGGWLGK